MPLSALFEEITNFLAPPRCKGCAAESPVLLCNTCLGVVHGLLTPNPSVEVMPPVDGIYSLFHDLRPSHLPARLVKWMKYSSTPEDAKFFAAFFASLMLKIHPDLLNKKFVLCPIPLHPLREHIRGFNQSMLIAESLSAQTGLPVLPLLTRRVYTPTQTKLTKNYRTKNILNIFSITDTKTVQNQPILLIDDLCTTGSTLREAAKTLKTVGACFVAALVIGRVGLKDSS